MRELKASKVRKVLRSAMRKGASVVNKASKATAPVRTGSLKRSLGVKVKAYPSGVIIGVVEPRKGNPKKPPKRGTNVKNIDPRFYAHLVEFGTKPHSVQKGASVRKKIGTGKMHPGARPKPFLFPGFNQNKERIVGIFGEEIDKELARL